MESKKKEGAFLFTTIDRNLDNHTAISFAYKSNGKHYVDKSMNIKKSVSAGGFELHSVDYLIQSMYFLRNRKTDISDFTSQDKNGMIYLDLGKIHEQFAIKDFLVTLFESPSRKTDPLEPWVLDTAIESLGSLTNTNSGIILARELWKKYIPKEVPAPEFLLEKPRRLPTKTFKSETQRLWRTLK